MKYSINIEFTDECRSSIVIDNSERNNLYRKIDEYTSRKKEICDMRAKLFDDYGDDLPHDAHVTLRKLNTELHYVNHYLGYYTNLVDAIEHIDAAMNLRLKFTDI